MSLSTVNMGRGSDRQTDRQTDCLLAFTIIIISPH